MIKDLRSSWKALENEEFKKVAIARGPTRGVIETAEVGMVISFLF